MRETATVTAKTISMSRVGAGGFMEGMERGRGYVVTLK